MSLHCTYRKREGSGYVYEARCGGRLASFKSVASLKSWAKKIAKVNKTTVTFEKV